MLQSLLVKGTKDKAKKKKKQRNRHNSYHALTSSNKGTEDMRKQTTKAQVK